MTARDFLPPMTQSPDLFLLDARFSHFGFPTMRTSRIQSRAAHLRNRDDHLLQQHPHFLNPLHRATLPMDASPPSYPQAEGRDNGVEWRSQPCLLQRKLDVLAANQRQGDFLETNHGRDGQNGDDYTCSLEFRDDYNINDKNNGRINTGNMDDNLHEYDERKGRPY